MTGAIRSQVILELPGDGIMYRALGSLMACDSVAKPDLLPTPPRYKDCIQQGTPLFTPVPDVGAPWGNTPWVTHSLAGAPWLPRGVQRRLRFAGIADTTAITLGKNYSQERPVQVLSFIQGVVSVPKEYFKEPDGLRERDDICFAVEFDQRTDGLRVWLVKATPSLQDGNTYIGSVTPDGISLANPAVIKLEIG